MNRIFLWFGVMNGICNNCVTFAIAKTRDEAKSLILAEFEKKLNGEVTHPSIIVCIKQADYEQMMDRMNYILSSNEDEDPSVTKTRKNKILLDTLTMNLDDKIPLEIDLAFAAAISDFIFSR